MVELMNEDFGIVVLFVLDFGRMKDEDSQMEVIIVASLW